MAPSGLRGLYFAASPAGPRGATPCGGTQVVPHDDPQQPDFKAAVEQWVATVKSGLPGGAVDPQRRDLPIGGPFSTTTVAGPHLEVRDLRSISSGNVEEAVRFDQRDTFGNAKDSAQAVLRNR